MQRVRRRVFFSGRVQGVGFRFTTCRVAELFEVAGFVRNLPDGRVEMVAEGDEATVSAFIAAVREAMGPCILGMDVLEDPATGEFSGFEIRY